MCKKWTIIYFQDLASYSFSPIRRYNVCVCVCLSKRKRNEFNHLSIEAKFYGIFNVMMNYLNQMPTNSQWNKF